MFCPQHLSVREIPTKTRLEYQYDIIMHPIGFMLVFAGRVARAVVFVCGLGYYKLHANGKQVSTHELGAFTTFTERAYYDTIDITDTINDAVAAGQHEQVVGVVLGDGWYSLGMGSVDPFDSGHPIAIGPPLLRLRAAIQYAQGPHELRGAEDMVSDTSWVWLPGPVEAANIYTGETYNASMETPGWTAPLFDTRGWAAASVVPAPSSHVKLTSHAVMPTIQTTQTFPACRMWEVANNAGTYVYDFCQNMAGFSSLVVPEGVAMEAGVRIVMLHAEAIMGPPENASGIYQHYGHCDAASRAGCMEYNTYITKGDGDAITYTPHFTYAGFRYVQLQNYPGTPDMETLTAHFTHTAYESTGAITFSDPMLTSVQQITRASARSNFMSVPTDCPQRERRGWLGDAQLSAETNLYNFDMGAPYTSFVQQINDAQHHASRFFNASYVFPRNFPILNYL